MEFRGLMGGFYRISEWIMRLSVTNVLWILTAIPVFFFVLNLLLSQTVEQIQASMFAIVVLSPFFLFPSTSAMFALARKWVMGDADVPLLKTFFRSYKENYKQSLIGGLFFTVLLAVLYFNYRFYASQEGYIALLSYVFIAFLIMAVLAVFNYFCIVVHLKMKTFQVIKNAILITMGQPFRAILIGITCFGILYISFTQITWLLPFFTGSLIAVSTFWYFYTGYRKIVDKYEAMQAQKQEEGGEAQKDKPAETTPSDSL